MQKLIIILLGLAIVACEPKEKQKAAAVPAASHEEVKEYLSQYEPYEMTFDARSYSENEKLILKKLVEAARYMDSAYWMQTSQYGLKLIDSLSKIQDEPYAADLLTLVQRNGGPHELLNEYETFLGTQDYYGGEELYPRGMTQEGFDTYVATLSSGEQAEFMDPYTVIQNDGNGGYKAVRYYEVFKQYVDPAVKLLREVAELSNEPAFSEFLTLKAEALTTDNYYTVDTTWVNMTDTKFDMVFGPFETYSDHIKGVKAKYEAYIEIIDQKASADLKKYTAYLKQMEENLPIPEEYKSVVDGLTATFTVVQDIIRMGEGRIGYQAVATNLPNDPKVHKTHGTKKTFWKNMFKARFNAIIKPVSEILIDPAQLQYLSDDGFFKFVLMHEICHAIGPREVKVGPKKGMAANAAIGPNYSPLEEAKADIVGLYSLAYLMDEGVEDPERAREFYVSFLGSLFRSIRFGLDEAHGKAAAISLSYLLENGGILYNEETKKWSIDFENFEQGVKNLAAEMLILEGDGDNEAVQAFFDQWAKETPMLAEAMEMTAEIAIDVMPVRKIIWE